MVILYGSYARGTYVDCDCRTEFGVTNYFLSDYDILIVTKWRLGLKEQNVYSKISDRFFENMNRGLRTKPQYINENITHLNKHLELGQYFYAEIVEQGVMLYDSGEYKLSECRELNYAEIYKIAQDYYDDKFHYAERFLYHGEIDYKDKEYKICSFQLHQATESYLKTIPLVYILYGYKEHELRFLIEKCKTHTLELATVFPCDTEEEKRLFNLLQDAYVQARYNKDFVVTKADIDALCPKSNFCGILPKESVRSGWRIMPKSQKRRRNKQRYQQKKGAFEIHTNLESPLFGYKNTLFAENKMIKMGCENYNCNETILPNFALGCSSCLQSDWNFSHSTLSLPKKSILYCSCRSNLYLLSSL